MHRWSFYAGSVGWICLDCGQAAAWKGGGRPCRECGARQEKEYAFDLCEHCESSYHFVCRDKPRTPEEVAAIRQAVELLRNAPALMDEPPKERKKKAKQLSFGTEIKNVRAEMKAMEDELRAEIKKGQNRED